MNRDELIQRLAEVSHLTYVRQKNRDQGVPLGELSLEVTDHDRERAQDIVVELERLGVLEGSTRVGDPEDAELARDPERTEPVRDSEPAEHAAPPQPESKRQPLTDIWGHPLTGRRGRRS